MKHPIPAITIFILIATAVTAQTGDSCRSCREWTGTQLLRTGSYDDAIRALRADTSYTDTGYHFFKLGLASYRLKDYATALTFLRLASRHAPRFSAICYEMIGDIESLRDNPQGSIAAYRAALDSASRDQLTRRLRKKISAVIVERKLDTAELSWTWSWFRRPAEVSRQDRQARLDSLVSRAEWPLVDSCVRGYLDTVDETDLCPLLGSFFSVQTPDSAFSTKLLYRISKAAFACQNWDLALSWLERAASRNNFAAAVKNDDYLLHRAAICARLARYADAVHWLSFFESKFGATPASVMALARAYRGMGNKQQASRNYQRYLNLFPRDSKTPDVVWYLAWQDEDSGEQQKALDLYRTIIRRFPRSPKAEESYFRAGLLFYKKAQYDSARTAWSSLAGKFPQSPWTTAAAYWQAKCLLAQMELDSAQSILRSVIAADPCNYYAFRSREMLALTADSQATQFTGDRSDEWSARQWLDSVSPPAGRTPLPDSAPYMTGTLLAAAGMLLEGGWYLDGLANNRPDDLLLQYDLSALYARCGAPAASFRIARRLSWRIAAPDRMHTPLAVYRVLYPQFYADIISREAQCNSISPALISGVIRQESVFDAAIVSPAGAIGLMQIMPATGRQIATALNEPFTPESLYNPATNIRFGAYYIRELIDQFDGNLTLAIASYNGGPHNAALWHAQNRNDAFDVFVEDIAFAETRGYVKKVLANFWTYGQLQKMPGYRSGEVTGEQQ